MIHPLVSVFTTEMLIKLNRFTTQAFDRKKNGINLAV